jgi:dTDP-4-amino-4,6-dideoxygalactose transaminase
MDGIQAAILSVKLPHIADWNAARRRNALLYNELLQDVDGIATPVIRPGATHIFHLYVIRTEQRDVLQTQLKQLDIDTAIHYPKPLPFLKAYKYLNAQPEEFHVAHEYQNKILSLPMFPELTPQQIEYVAAAVKKVLSTTAKPVQLEYAS